MVDGAGNTGEAVVDGASTELAVAGLEEGAAETRPCAAPEHEANSSAAATTMSERRRSTGPVWTSGRERLL